MAIIHQNLAAGRWQTLSLAEQLGNIGSEIGRAVGYITTGNNERLNSALARAFDLIDLTLADKRWRGRRREIARLREVCVDSFYGNQEYKTTPADLEKYLYRFALLARNNK